MTCHQALVNILHRMSFQFPGVLTWFVFGTYFTNFFSYHLYPKAYLGVFFFSLNCKNFTKLSSYCHSACFHLISRTSGVVLSGWCERQFISFDSVLSPILRTLNLNSELSSVVVIKTVFLNTSLCFNLWEIFKQVTSHCTKQRLLSFIATCLKHFVLDKQCIIRAIQTYYKRYIRIQFTSFSPTDLWADLDQPATPF